MSLTIPAIQKVRPYAQHLELCEAVRPSIQDNEVLIEVRAAGICGSDVHLYAWDESIRDRLLAASNHFRQGLTIGHELCGTIVEIGAAVNAPGSFQYGALKVGDFVSAESHVTCGECYQCARGQHHVCERDVVIGFDRAGGFSKYIALPASCAWVCEPGLEPELAAIQEPLGNAMHAVRSFPVAGQRVVIFGAGPIGLMSAAIAKSSNARQVVIVDVNPHRLAIARRLGVDTLLLEKQDRRARSLEELSDSTDDLERSLSALTRGIKPDIVLEMSGSSEAIDGAFRIVRRGGSVVLFGIPKARTIQLGDYTRNIIFKGVTIKAVIGRQIYQTWEQTRDFLHVPENRALLRNIITDVLPFSKFNEAFAKILSGTSGKIILDFSKA